jgi:hypothetical protein
LYAPPAEPYYAPPAPVPQPAPVHVQAQATPAPATTRSSQGLRVAGIITGVTGLVAVTGAIICGAEAKAYSDSIQILRTPWVGELASQPERQIATATTPMG